MKVGSLFAGIGGFDLGLESAGMEIAWQVEIDDYCRKVLTKHWPAVPKHGDIHNVGKHNLSPVDLICGGFPCQPFSVAGKQRGKDDNRYLWPEMLRVISDLKPTWVIGENVSGIINMELDKVCTDLEAKGYEVQPIIIPACAVNAPHRRDRVWIIGYAASSAERQIAGICKGAPPDSESRETQPAKSGGLHAEFSGQNRNASDLHGTGLQERKGEMSIREREDCGAITFGTDRGTWLEPWIKVATRLCRVDDGLSRQVDRVKRLKALGNAVVPQILYILGKMIMEIDQKCQ